MKTLGLLLLCGLVAGAQEVKVPAGQRVVLTTQARGAQIYHCENTDAGAKWVFMAPDADLYVGGAGVGKHSAGPTWTYKDGSSVKGTVVTTVEATRKGAVPWLLLRGVGSGGGLLGNVDYVTRTGTLGGMVGTTVDGTVDRDVCDAHTAGTILRKDYVATYTFYVAK